jgi:DNA-binding NtrC family response regulator
MHRILIVDDEASMLKGIEFHLRENQEYEILTASDKNTAIEQLESNELDLVVSDLMLPEIKDGLTVMKTAKDQWYEPSVLAMTAFESVENAVNAMKAGADDFIPKGFGLDEMSLRIENMLKKRAQIEQLAIENRLLKEAIQKLYSDYQIIGKSPKIKDLMKKVKRVAADARASCLLKGESGTGKDLVARTIHALSSRRNDPFVPINCAAIPENLIESELFGHEKGSFTGAYTTKQGKFEHARGGIIFLDEIGELPLPLQVRLLRVLEDKNFYRIGGKSAIHVDVMVISATNSDLNTLVKQGLFREDLYYRLNVVSIWVPPLRERSEDIRLLAQFFLEKFNQERNKNLKLSRDSLQLLESYDFPGNVRELRNIIEDAFVFTDGQWIQPQNLSLRHTTAKRKGKFSQNTNSRVVEELNQLPYKDALEHFEKNYFYKLIEDSHWNINEAAKKAGMSREWLSKKVNKLGLKKM